MSANPRGFPPQIASSEIHLFQPGTRGLCRANHCRSLAAQPAAACRAAFTAAQLLTYKSKSHCIKPRSLPRSLAIYSSPEPADFGERPNSTLRLSCAKLFRRFPDMKRPSAVYAAYKSRLIRRKTVEDTLEAKQLPQPAAQPATQLLTYKSKSHCIPHSLPRIAAQPAATAYI